jgi:hypothetical protein
MAVTGLFTTPAKTQVNPVHIRRLQQPCNHPWVRIRSVSTG